MPGMDDIEIELEACTPLHTLHSSLGSEILTCTGTPALESVMHAPISANSLAYHTHT